MSVFMTEHKDLNNIVLSSTPSMVIRNKDDSGMCNTLITPKDGKWYIKVFPTEWHAREFADQNGLEVTDLFG